MDRDLRDETMSHGETNPVTKAEERSPKVLYGRILYALAVLYTRACVKYMSYKLETVGTFLASISE